MSNHQIGLHELHGLVGPGAAAVEAGLRATNPRLADVLVDYGFGQILSRGELTRHDRELITLTLLATLGGADQHLRVHLPAAVRSGVTIEELQALGEHLCGYIGMPRALSYHQELVKYLQEAKLTPQWLAHKVHLGDHDTYLIDTDLGGHPAAKSDESPLILLHALGLDHRAWQDVLPLLAPRRRVIAYDMRAHGLARMALPGFTVKTLADDLKLLMDQRQIPKAEIAGVSYGGVVAQCFAVRYPAMVTALNLVCTPAKSSRLLWKEPLRRKRKGWLPRWGRLSRGGLMSKHWR